MEQILIKNAKYNGRYIAIKDLSNKRVIAYGKDPKEAYNGAVRKGHRNPLILYIPTKGMAQIY
jgi:hypothetical protein